MFWKRLFRLSHAQPHLREPRFNVLVRTSCRPNYFRCCYDSIVTQTYDNVRILVSWDNAETKAYLDDYRDIHTVRVESTSQDCSLTPDIPRGKPVPRFPANLYLNTLMQHVEPGFILYLDDDDELASPSSLRIIADHLTSENDLVFWRVGFPDGKVVPEDEYFGMPPVFWHISAIGFAFHSKYVHLAQWDGWKGGDFAVATKLFTAVPNKVYIDQTLTRLQRGQGTGGFGRQDDKAGP